MFTFHSKIALYRHNKLFNFYYCEYLNTTWKSNDVDKLIKHDLIWTWLTGLLGQRKYSHWLLYTAVYSITIRIIWQFFLFFFFTRLAFQVWNSRGTDCLDIFTFSSLVLFFSGSGTDVCNYFMFFIQLFCSLRRLQERGLCWLCS